MTKRIIFDLYSQNFQQSIQVFLEIPDVGRWQGKLSSALTLFRLSEQWRSYYWGLAQAYRVTVESVDFGASAEAQIEACHRSAQVLETQFQAWLKGEDFQHITERFREHLQPEEEICLLLRTNQPELRQLPWHAWDLLKRYKRTEVVLSSPTAEKPPELKLPHKTEQSQMQILAVLGNDEGIDIEHDRAFLKTFSPEAKTQFLVRPLRETLFDVLSSQPWDIFFFAGHSYTEGQHGIISLNSTEPPLKLAMLTPALEQAISSGLQLAIFNSCDGLGLAQDLETLNIPHLVVMREPVPDAIAQRFLRSFLTSYCRDLPLHLAVRQARESLVIKETEFPSASYLPILCQNSTTPPPTWRSLRTGGRVGGSVFQEVRTAIANKESTHPPQRRSRASLSRRRQLQIMLVASVMTIGLIFGLREMGLLENSELSTFDRLMQARPLETPDSRILLVTIDDEDFEYQQELGYPPEGGHISNAVLEKLLQKLEVFQPRVVGVGILRSGSLAGDSNNILQRIDDYPSEILFSCEIPFENNGERTYGASPPQEIQTENTGFSNFLNEDVVRRQPIFIFNKDLRSTCTVQTSFSSALALSYLSKEKDLQTNPKVIRPNDFFGNNLEIDFHHEGKLISLNRFPGNSGGYQLAVPDGYSILLNYRSLSHPEDIAETISLKEILENEITSAAIQRLQNRLIIIGGTIPSSSESFTTPFRNDGKNIEVKGLFLYAHMASQIMSTVLEGRKLIWSWPNWLEYLWMVLWAGLSSFIVMNIRKPLHLTIAITLSMFILLQICQFAMNQAGWIPLVPATLSMLSTSVITMLIIHRKFNLSALIDD